MRTATRCLPWGALRWRWPMSEIKVPVSSYNAATNLTPTNVAIPTGVNRVDIVATTIDAYVGVHTAATGFTPTAANSIRVKAGAFPTTLYLDPARYSARTAAGLAGTAATRAQTHIHVVGVAAGPGTIDVNFFK